MTNMLHRLKSATTTRLFWFLACITTLILNGIALYAQHYLGLEPCNECIYIRFGVLGLLCAGVLGLISPKTAYLRSITLLLWCASLIWSLYRTNLLRTLERNVRSGLPAGCGRFKGFPEWLPLDQWFPAMFEPRAMCGENQQMFLSYTFSDWTWFGLIALTCITILVVWAQMKPRSQKK